MEGYLLILLFTVLNLGESVVVKTYAKRHGDGGMLMNAVIAFFACAFFATSAIIDKGYYNIPTEMIPYALINSIAYASGFYFAYVAFRVGPYGLTRVISNFSLMFSIVYGIFFLNEPTTPLTYIGFVLIVAAMLLVNYNSKKKKDGEEEGKISLKWLIAIIITVVSNGCIAILGRMQQIEFNNTCSTEFQMFSTGGAFLLLAVLGIITDRKKIGSVVKNGVLYGVGAGLINGAKNFIGLMVYLFLPLSVVSPTKTGLGMVAAFIFSIFFYKEKYSLAQKIGVLCGIAAVVLLAI